jgi:hypothetical protein
LSTRHHHQQQQQQHPQQHEEAPTSVLLLRCLEQQLLGVKQSDMGRLAAFCKRLAGLMLVAGAAEGLGAACLLWRLLQRYPKLLCLLEWEGGAPVGGQQYVPDCADPSEAGALAAALWELPLAAQHYHPHVARAARALLGLTPGSTQAGGAGDARGAAGRGGSSGGGAVVSGVAGPQEVAAAYEPVRRGGFRPPPPPPPAAAAGRGIAAGGGGSRAGMAARVAAAVRPWTPELQQVVRQQQQAQVSNDADGHAGDAGLGAVRGMLSQHYALSRLYRRNQQLRRELAVQAKRLQLFREHLIQRREAEEKNVGPPRKRKA